MRLSGVETSRPPAAPHGREIARGAILAAGCLALLLRPSGPVAAQQSGGLAQLLAVQEILADVIQRTEKSVVAISRVRRRPLDDGIGRFSSGRRNVTPGDPEFVPNDVATGVIIDRRGLVLTTNHALGEHETSEYWITTVDRQTRQALIKGTDPRGDLAVLQLLNVDGSIDLNPIELGDATTLRKGHFVIALGNPYGIAKDGQTSASFGIVTNLSRKAPPLPGNAVEPKVTTFHEYGTLIQTDAKLNYGTSGGPLLNLHGKMVGLNTSLAAVSGYDQSAGYAIPVDEEFLRIVQTLKEGREVDYGFLGIELNRTPTPPRINNVVWGLPASRSGIRPNDVITHINGRPVYDSDGVFLNIGRLPAGAEVHVQVNRNGHPQTFDVQLTKYPVTWDPVVTNAPPRWRGLLIDVASAVVSSEILKQVPDVLSLGCVAVRAVDAGSPADEAGLRAGQLITHVAGRRVSTPQGFHAAVARASGAVEFRLESKTGPLQSWLVPPERP